MLFKTHDILKDILIPKLVCYADFIDHNDLWENDLYQKSLQRGEDIGIRMKNAFSDAFSKGYKSVVLIGTDIIDISASIIYEAFDVLNDTDVVFGPAKDGGYYLVGMKTLHEDLFHNIYWSSNEVFIQSLKNCINFGLGVKLVRELSDLDRIEDFQYLSFEDRKRYFDMMRVNIFQVFSPDKKIIKKGA
jgi:rSAM/selenodomain-associated transferase 1